MTSTVFVDNVTPIPASWLNDVNTRTYADNVKSVTQFGAKGDGVTDDSTAINAGLTYVKTNGGTLYFPDGTYRCKNLRLDGNTKYYSVIGNGKSRVTLKHFDSSGSMFNDDGPGTIGYNVEGFTLDMQYSVYHSASANHGFAIKQRSNVTIRNVHITDFYNGAILMYDPDATGNYGDNSVIDCSCDGLGVGSNGFLFSNMNRCSYLRVYAKGVIDRGTEAGPGVAVQFKNNCKWGTATDVIGENSRTAFGLAGDTTYPTPGPSYITAVNIKGINCDNGLRLGNGTTHCTITNAVLSQSTGSTSDVVKLTDYAYGNSLENINIINVASTKRAVFFDTNASNNDVHISVLDSGMTGAPVVVFNNACQYNNVRLSRALNPRLRTTYGLSRMADFTTPSDNNSFTYDNYPYWDSLTIASGTITLENAVSEQYVLVDTEGSAATDDLDTITNNYAQDGQQVIIRTVNSARDVTINSLAGNIALTSGTLSITLTNNRAMLCLVWSASAARWEQAWFANLL